MVILLHLYFSLSVVVVVGTLLLVYSMCHGNLTVMRVVVALRNRNQVKRT